MVHRAVIPPNPVLLKACHHFHLKRLWFQCEMSPWAPWSPAGGTVLGKVVVPLGGVALRGRVLRFIAPHPFLSSAPWLLMQVQPTHSPAAMMSLL